MRVLFTTTGSAGHLGPLLPFADAVRDAGGDVLIATRESSAERAAATAHEVWPFADAPATLRNAVMSSIRGMQGDDANLRMATDVFGGIDARAALPGLREALEAWRPDVLVSEPSEFAGRVVAAEAGLPLVTVAITQFVIEHRMREATGLAARRLIAQSRFAAPRAAEPRFTLMPPLLEDPALPGPPDVRRFRERDGAHRLRCRTGGTAPAGRSST